MRPSTPDSGSDPSQRIDTRLRRALDAPEAAERAARRLVQTALAAREAPASEALDASAGRPRRYGWRLATAAVVTAALALLILQRNPVTSPEPTTAHIPAATTAPSEVPRSKPVVLEISNADGPVTVS
ncbi:MAG: hypothetical protein AAF560_28955, partial [Acidobacteriota bacterium]